MSIVTSLRNPATLVTVRPRTTENVIHQSPQLLGPELHHSVCTQPPTPPHPTPVTQAAPSRWLRMAGILRIRWRSPSAPGFPSMLAKPCLDSTAVSDVPSHFLPSFSRALVRLASLEGSPSIFQLPPNFLPRHFPKENPCTVYPTGQSSSQEAWINRSLNNWE